MSDSRYTFVPAMTPGSNGAALQEQTLVRLKKQVREARAAGDAWAAGLRTTVRCNPLAALAAALALGALISRVTR